MLNSINKKSSRVIGSEIPPVPHVAGMQSGKKIFTLLAAALLFSFLVSAQPVLQQANIPGVGFTGTIMAGGAASPGLAGANQTWNFSTVTMGFYGTISTVICGSTPFSSSFPTATNCWEAMTATDTVYTYYRETLNILEELGQNISATGGINFTPNPKSDLKFPFQYNDTLTDNWQTTTGGNGTVQRIYDGYGTLITPFATFTNVVRITSTAASSNTIWYNTNPIYPLFRIGGSISLCMTNTNVGIQETGDDNSFYVYPNPATNQLAIGIPMLREQYAIRGIEIYDTLGHKVFSQYKTSPDASGLKPPITIDISQLTQGIYFVTVMNDAGNKAVRKMVKM